MPLTKVLLTETDTALQAASFSNAYVNHGGVYEDEAPEESRYLVYAIVSVQSEFPHPATDRQRQFNDHLVFITVWGPDVRSPKEAAAAIKERLCAKTGGVSTNISMTGFVVTDVRMEYQNPAYQQRASFTTSQADRIFGQILALRVVCYPT